MQALAEAWQFGRFRLEPNRRLLFADGEPVALSSRAYDILELLVRCHDRVVTRDEIVSHVWRGVTVGENNLAVQMSNLRRVLGDHVDGQPLIVNLPGRGYRLVAEVIDLNIDLQPTGFSLTDQSIPNTLALPPDPSSTRQVVLWGLGGLLLAWSVIVIALLMSLFPNGSLLQVPDARLTIRVSRFEAVEQDPHMIAVAAAYREAILAHFVPYEDLKLFPDSTQVPVGFVPHFQLTGLVQISDNDGIFTIGLTQEPDGQLLYRRSFPISAAETASERSAAALQVLTDLRPILFHAEVARRKGVPKDGLDLIIDAHDVLGVATERASYEHAIDLAERALRRGSDDRPARSLLAYLLAHDMLFSGAARGDDEGISALAMMDQVVRAAPNNSLYLSRRVYVLEALGRLDDALATAELGLRIAPDNPFLRDKFAEIQMMKGNIATAKNILRPNPNDLQDDVPATIAFAEERYSDCLVSVQAIVASTPTAHYTPFNILLEVATLDRLGRVQEAKALLVSAIEKIPGDLRTVHAQRQMAYVLPDVAWKQFKIGLSEAGMNP